jgi:hypothetical protein
MKIILGLALAISGLIFCSWLAYRSIISLKRGEAMLESSLPRALAGIVVSLIMLWILLFKIM